MTSWPVHLVTPRFEKPLTFVAQAVPDFTACGIRVYGRTWRGWDTVPGGATIAGMWNTAEGVDCVSCIRTKRFKSLQKET